MPESWRSSNKSSHNREADLRPGGTELIWIFYAALAMIVSCIDDKYIDTAKPDP
jgi:hypothetical protein